MKDTKATLREHFTSVYNQTGVMPPELANEKEVPPPVRYIWQWFEELHTARGGSGFGPSPISFCEIDAWARLTGRLPEAWEVQVIKDIDVCYLSSAMQHAEAERSK